MYREILFCLCVYICIHKLFIKRTHMIYSIPYYNIISLV